MMRLPVTMASDFICPWCYIGERKLMSAIERLPADVQVDVSYRPFELNPDMPAGGLDRKEYRSASSGAGPSRRPLMPRSRTRARPWASPSTTTGSSAPRTRCYRTG